MIVDEEPLRRRRSLRRVLPMRVLIPNAVTILALCSGLTGVRFAIAGDWERAIAAIIVAGILDGIDGRIARLLKGQSRFGAELDSLSDVIAFGVSPAVIVYLWSLQHLPGLGWVFALAHAVCCALRLARFNANLDVDEQPRKAAGFLTGVPAPVGAGLALAPVYLWMATDLEVLRSVPVVAATTAVTAFLMISSIPTFSWASTRIPSAWRLPVLVGVGLFGGALFSAPWITLSTIAVVYLLTLPFSIRAYGRIKRQPVPASAQAAATSRAAAGQGPA
jgi:CDP-diacylglycerol--serine O-phosphatidyltransferase